MLTGIKVILMFLLVPMSKMKKVNTINFLRNPDNKDIIYPNETLYTAYDNKINSFLITNTRLISVFKLRNRIKIFSIPLFQLGTLDTFSFKLFKLKAICITSSPGYNFYWFFRYEVSMEELSNEISKVVADVQISGGSKLNKIF
ncbi:MAG: hypothetical protein ACRCVB_03475 [Cetobacterium sp.]|uniref:hypothetical protein n=1 Tax=unclassified Cetobacterium TaxID=2630983 RepID=UPI0006463AA2|nr:MULTISPECIES: hypothetical protein [unclassified Cetobacterium]